MRANEITLPRPDLFDPGAETSVGVAGLINRLSAMTRTASARIAAYWQFRRELAEALRFDDRILADMGLTHNDLMASRRAGRWIREAQSC